MAIKENPPLVESKTIYDYVKTNVQAIAFETSSTVSLVGGRLVSKQHPKCFMWFNRFFGQQWSHVLGAFLSERNAKTEQIVAKGPIPVGFVYRKLLLACPVKPNFLWPNDKNFALSDAVKRIDDLKVYPGYLAKTRMIDVKDFGFGLVRYADTTGLTKIVVSPPYVTDNYISADEAVAEMVNILDSRFIIARSGF
jgi:hypothetical protein